MAKKRKKKKLTEDAALEIAIRDHPEWREALERGELPEEILGEDGQPMSPQVHLDIHAAVEQQIANDEPEGVAEIAQELRELGVSRHDVRHVIGTVITEHMWYMLKEGCPFDEGRYLADLRRAVESYR